VPADPPLSRENLQARGRTGDMQVRPVRMKESHRPLTTALAAPSDIRKVLSSASKVSHLIPIVFPTQGKRSSIPPCGPSIRPRNCTNGGQFRDLEDRTGYWIGSPAIYQAGGPPLDVEKGEPAFVGLRDDLPPTPMAGLAGECRFSVKGAASPCYS